MFMNKIYVLTPPQMGASMSHDAAASLTGLVSIRFNYTCPN